MAHSYDELVAHLLGAIEKLKALGLGESLSKGRVGEILLAHHLGHTLKPGDKGADGLGTDGKKYEYKVSTTDSNQYNFNFGHADRDGDRGRLVEEHFAGYEGAFCALASTGRLVKVVYCPASSLVPHLKNHLDGIKGKTFQKNFSPIERFAEVPGASWILKPAEV